MDYYLLISYYLLFPLTLILVSLPLILRRRNSVPPGTTGWPVLGETLTMSRNPKKFIFDKMKKTSSKVFKTSLLGEKTVVLCGQEGNKFIFSNANGSLKKWLPKSLCKLLTGTTNIEFNFGFLHQIMKPESLKKYAPLMDSVAREQLRLHWTHGQVVKVFPLARRFTFGPARDGL
ncbi:beta-amyrin 6-beta-monooxygenase-like [Impatiens glandulifera]|uniref:beta-amyrin 6-beta-monooxygenase-like n=1 Tax=Impatiens glandulifera TaxID=253017 RepID=UPI001FB1955C|nr:beta-amyrin 6-beta-monooxygenase-like [Impatiens glandulifera]